MTMVVNDRNPLVLLCPIAEDLPACHLPQRWLYSGRKLLEYIPERNKRIGSRRFGTF